MTRLEGLESSRVKKILHDSKMNLTFFSTFCNWAKWNLARWLIYNAIVTEKE